MKNRTITCSLVCIKKYSEKTLFREKDLGDKEVQSIILQVRNKTSAKIETDP
jgi:hypothetical protein